MKVAIAALAAVGLSLAAPAWSHGDDDPLLAKVALNQLEWCRATGGDAGALVWQADAWLGRDRDKLWLKAEGERVEGVTQEAELQLRYSRAVAPFWDAQIGWRADLGPGPERHWLAAGLRGLAPYWFDTDVALFADAEGRTALRIEAEYELLFTQRLILSPELEVNIYGQDDRATGTASGLSDAEFGLRLRYEIHRELAPYVGLVGWRKFGDSADFAQREGERSDDLHWVIGVRAWF